MPCYAGGTSQLDLIVLPRSGQRSTGSLRVIYVALESAFWAPMVRLAKCLSSCRLWKLRGGRRYPEPYCAMRIRRVAGTTTVLFVACDDVDGDWVIECALFCINRG